MKRSLRITGYVLGGMGLTILLLVLVFLFFTRTEYGIERVRRQLVERAASGIQGELRVATITTESGLTGDVVLHDVSIDDPEGRPFLRADSIHLNYDIRTLLGGQVVLDPVVLFDPEIYLTRMPGDTAWNYEYIFQDTTPQEPGPDRLVLLEDAAIVNGLVEIRLPLEPDEPVEPEDTARMVLERVPGGILRVVRFENIDANLPRVVWSSPVEDGRLFRVADLSTRGYIWETPLEIVELEGTVAMQDSVLSFEAPTIRLPESRLEGVGRVIFGEEMRYNIRLDGSAVALEDFQWLHPDLPEEGGGDLVLRMQTQPDGGTLWLVQDAHIRTEGTELAGSFGVVTGDTLYFTQVDLRADPIDMDLVQRLLPGDLPVEGLVIGSLRVEGPISSLETSGDLRLSRNGTTGASVRWNGTVDLRGGGFTARRLHADVRTLDLALVEAFQPGFGAHGSVSGRIDATTSRAGALRFTGLLRHLGRTGGAESVLEATGSWRGGRALDARIQARTVDLATLAERVPALRGLRGSASGPVTLFGPLHDLGVEARVETEGGPLALSGRLDLAGRVPAYAVQSSFTAFRVDRMLGGGPEATLTGVLRVDGSGTGAEGVHAAIAADLEGGSFGGVEITGGAVRARLAGGLLHVDSAALTSAAGSLHGRGGFGIAAGRSGTLDWALRADSLAELRPLLLPGSEPRLFAGDTALVGGRLRADGTLEGGLTGFRLAADAQVERGVLGSHYLNGGVRVAASGVGTSVVRATATLVADSVQLFGRPLRAATASATYTADSGALELHADAPGSRSYRVAGDVVRSAAGAELRLRSLELRDPDQQWTLPRVAVLRVDSGGLALSAFDLVSAAGTGRISAEGRLPWSPGADSAGVAGRAVDFRVHLEGVPLEDWIPVLAPSLDAAGSLAGSLHLHGTAERPVATADVGLNDVRYTDLRLERIGGRATYADRRLEVHGAAAERGGRISLSAGGVVPVDLSLVPGAERHTGERIDISVRADSLSAALPVALFEGYRRVAGRVDGTFTVGGTTRDPVLAGQATVREAGFDVVAGGVRVRDVAADLRLLDDNVLEVTGTAASGSGAASVAGTVTFDRLRNPEFALEVSASGFEAARRRDIDLVASGDLRLSGRLAQPRLEGQWRVDRGALYLDELIREYRVVDLETDLLFNVVDTAQVSIRTIRTDTMSAFLRNLVVDATVDVGRDFWLRSPEINVEVSGQLGVALDRQAEDLRLTGSLSAVRGTYQIFGRRFQVRHGSVEFLGTSGVNPNLDIAAAYRAPIGQGQARDVLDIFAVVSGTLLDPRVRLTNDTTGAEAAISESDLASYLIFGRPTYGLAGGEADALASARGLVAGGVAPSLLGYGAAALEGVARNIGIVDYVAVTAGDVAGAPGQGGTDYLQYFQNAEVEVGRYWTDRLYLALAKRIATANSFGARLEYRLDWMTGELFYQEGLERSRYFNLDAAVLPRRKYGVFLFREWGF